MSDKRVIFFGTPDYAVPSLRALADSWHEVALVVTNPDRVRRRGRKTEPAPVKIAAEDLGFDVYTPENVNAPEAIQRIRAAEPDVLAVVAYGSIMSRHLLEAAPLGGVNAHGSLLPRWRGAAPIEHAIMAGDAETGVTMMRMVRKMDAGPMFSRRAVRIETSDTGGTLREKLSALSAEMFPSTLADLEELPAEPQDEAQATLAPKITREDLRVDWTREAMEIHRRIRAFNPAPGAFAMLPDGKRLKIFDAMPGPAVSGPPGKVDTSDGLHVATSEGSLKLLEVQPEGKKRMDAGSFLRGYAVPEVMV